MRNAKLMGLAAPEPEDWTALRYADKKYALILEGAATRLPDGTFFGRGTPVAAIAAKAEVNSYMAAPVADYFPPCGEVTGK